VADMSELNQPVVKEWILGSSSKWRQGIFKKEFGTATFAAADIDEKAIRHPKAEIMTQLIAKAKADEILRRGELELKDRVLVCCDQVIRFRGEIREKPVSRDQCRLFLQSYMENPDEYVECVNGICVYYNGRFLSHFEVSKLTFKNLTAGKIESLVLLDDLMTCAGGFTISHMELGQLQGSIYGVEGLPVDMVRSLGNLCARLKVQGNITHCTVDLRTLIKDVETSDLLPGVEGFLGQLQTANTELCLLRGVSGPAFEQIRASPNGYILMETFGEKIVCEEELLNNAAEITHGIFFASDFEFVSELVEAGQVVVVVGATRSGDNDTRASMQIDSLADFDLDQFVQ